MVVRKAARAPGTNAPGRRLRSTPARFHSDMPLAGLCQMAGLEITRIERGLTGNVSSRGKSVLGRRARAGQGATGKHPSPSPATDRRQAERFGRFLLEEWALAAAPHQQHRTNSGPGGLPRPATAAATPRSWAGCASPASTTVQVNRSGPAPSAGC
jgi:hypothetical protein